MQVAIAILTLVLFSGCSSSREETLWSKAEVIALGDIAPIGIAKANETIWISDGDNNRMAQLDMEGNLLAQRSGFERPMHIEAVGETIYVPEYGADRITFFDQHESDSLDVPSLDAPAGIAISGSKIAIADFYNHSVQYFNGLGWRSLGEKGNGPGQFHYPTDVQFHNGRLFVADAYNHRFQVFDDQLNHLATAGESDSLNAATGIYVSNSEIFLTDFENSRVLVYDHDYNLKQVITDSLNKPTDLIQIENTLLIINYKGKNISIFNR